MWKPPIYFLFVAALFLKLCTSTHDSKITEIHTIDGSSTPKSSSARCPNSGQLQQQPLLGKKSSSPRHPAKAVLQMTPHLLDRVKQSRDHAKPAVVKIENLHLLRNYCNEMLSLQEPQRAFLNKLQGRTDDPFHFLSEQRRKYWTQVGKIYSLHTFPRLSRDVRTHISTLDSMRSLVERHSTASRNPNMVLNDLLRLSRRDDDFNKEDRQILFEFCDKYVNFEGQVIRKDLESQQAACMYRDVADVQDLVDRALIAEKKLKLLTKRDLRSRLSGLMSFTQTKRP